MKKIYLLFCILATAYASSAQTFPNAGMETWRGGVSGSTTADSVHAPTQWYGFDSLIIADGQTYAPLIHFGMPWNGGPQLFHETTIVHSGTSSAKMMTLIQDTLGYFPGILTNAVPAVNVEALIGGGSAASALSYSGGTGVTMKIKTVTAWVQYIPGVDSTGAHGNDTGEMIVQAIGWIGGKDSVLGIGTLNILPTSGSWVQITDSIVYTDNVDDVDTIRVNFASSGGASVNLDSSTLYVDDVAMVGGPEPSAVQTIIKNTDLVKVYPNPANTTLYIDCPQSSNLNCQLFSVGGQVVMTQQLATNNILNIADLPAGLYFYSITDNSGKTVQRGKVSVAK